MSKKYAKAARISLIIGIISYIIPLLTDIFELLLPVFFICIQLSIHCFLVFIITKIFKKFSATGKLSKYLIALDLITIIVGTIFGFADLQTAKSGELYGIFGALTLYLIVPASVLSLITDLVIYLKTPSYE